MPPALFRIWVAYTAFLAFALVTIGIWDSLQDGFEAFAACLSALALFSALSYASLLILASIIGQEQGGPPPADC